MLVFHLQVCVFANSAERHSLGKQEAPRGMLCAMARRQATKFIAPSQQQDFPASNSTAESSMEEGEMKPKGLRAAADQLQEEDRKLQSSEDAELHGSAQAAPQGGKAAKEGHSETQEKSSAGEEAAANKTSAKTLEVASEGSKFSTCACGSGQWHSWPMISHFQTLSVARL